MYKNSILKTCPNPIDSYFQVIWLFSFLEQILVFGRDPSIDDQMVYIFKSRIDN